MTDRSVAAEALSCSVSVSLILMGTWYSMPLAPTTAGRTVLRSAYCIRREIGECLRENPRLRGGLWLERGRHRYRLDFDCRRCEMSLVDCTSDTDGTT